MDWIFGGVNDQISFVAIDSKTGKVVACRLNSKDYENKPPEPDPGYTGGMLLVWNYINALGKNIYSLLPPSNPPAGNQPRRLLKLEIVCVNPAYRRRGIAQRLLEMTLALASRENFDYIYATATSYKTQQLFKKLGFESLRSLSYAEYRDPSGVKPFENKMKPDDTEGQLLYKKVEKG